MNLKHFCIFMQTLALALIQFNPCVGAIQKNTEQIITLATQAAREGAHLLLFPELCLSGYPPEDLILKSHFSETCEAALSEIAQALPKDIIAIIGSPIAQAEGTGNAAAILHNGTTAAIYHKMLLPNYGVFDEKRVFVAGDSPLLLEMGAARLAINICEDSWYPDSPALQALEGVSLDALLNLSASPFHAKKIEQRTRILQDAANQLDCPLCYCNLLGGQDELVFDGGSMVINPDGSVSAQAPQFEEAILHYALPVKDKKPATDLQAVALPAINNNTTLPANPPAPSYDYYQEVYEALKLGTRDYVNKNGFQKAVIAISGGIDSALVAAIAVDALGADRVIGVTMPSQYSSAETFSDAEKLAENLGFPLHTLPIENIFNHYLDDLSDMWEGLEPGLAEENLQARIRGNLIMALSNKFGWIVLTTGNKSELATGYCTLYGDMAGGFAVIKDVPKCLVFELSRWRNEQASIAIPPSTIERPPSAELRPDQKDTDSLPPYEVLDGIIERFIEMDYSREQIIADGFDADVVHRITRLIDINEYKRRQAPPGIKITPKAFGRDRRMPITNHFSK